jgi:hypothetical protein
MATFVYRICNACKIGSVVPDDESIQQRHKCKECGKVGQWEQKAKEARKHAGIIIPDSGWSTENGGRGHYFSQLEDKPSTKRSAHAFCQSAGEFKRKLAERDLKVTRDGY